MYVYVYHRDVRCMQCIAMSNLYICTASVSGRLYLSICIYLLEALSSADRFEGSLPAHVSVDKSGRRPWAVKGVKDVKGGVATKRTPSRTACWSMRVEKRKVLRTVHMFSESSRDSGAIEFIVSNVLRL